MHKEIDLKFPLSWDWEWSQFSMQNVKRKKGKDSNDKIHSHTFKAILYGY